MKKLAITGGIACGKSLCAHYFEALGCPVCDTDHLAHALLAHGQPAHDKVVEHFGHRIIDKNGNIDRGKLGRQVFHDPEMLQALNALMHPLIRQHMQAWIVEARRRDPVAVAVQIPLFFEIGEQREAWDLVLCVAASVSVYRNRMRWRGWSNAEIDARLRAQWPLPEKVYHADVVFHNDGCSAWLQRQVDVAWSRISKLEIE